jgi:hypothetical protein
MQEQKANRQTTQHEPPRLATSPESSLARAAWGNALGATLSHLTPPVGEVGRLGGQAGAGVEGGEVLRGEGLARSERGPRRERRVDGRGFGDAGVVCFGVFGWER